MKQTLIRARSPCCGWEARLLARPWTGYAVAAGATALAALVRLVLGNWFAGLPPFITFYPAVIAAAVVGGTRAGISLPAFAASRLRC